MCIWACTHVLVHIAKGKKRDKPIPTSWHLISGKPSVSHSFLLSESREQSRAQQFTGNIPSDDLCRYFLFIISLLFVSANFALTVSR